MHIGKIIKASVSMAVFFAFIAFDLLVFGVVAMDSVVLTILPFLGLVLGAVLGVVIQSWHRAVAPAAAAAPGMPPPPPPA